jgi:D-glycero-alpha-D-manno-heptose-7-phosphate kinase
VYAGQFDLLGEAMLRNTDAQERLHPSLVSAAARRIFEVARAHGAMGWKVNGAGGEGGSVTILCGSSSERKRAMVREIEQEDALFQNIPVYLSRHGLRIWEYKPQSRPAARKASSRRSRVERKGERCERRC